MSLQGRIHDVSQGVLPVAPRSDGTVVLESASVKPWNRQSNREQRSCLLLQEPPGNHSTKVAVE